jgi:hypothetical protein
MPDTFEDAAWIFNGNEPEPVFHISNERHQPVCGQQIQDIVVVDAAPPKQGQRICEDCRSISGV